MKKLLSSSLVVFLAIALAACNKGADGDGTLLSSGDKTLAGNKAITLFSFASPAAIGIIDENAKTISVTVPFGTNVTALVATFTATGASVKVGSTVQVSGTTPNDFTNTVAYTVTAADGTTATYAVTLTAASSSAKAIATFSILGIAGTINEISKTISVTVPFGTDVTALVATFTTTGASLRVGSAIQVSGTTPNDFTNPVDYIATAADGTTATYTVTVSPGPANTGVRSSYTTTFPLTEDPVSEGGNWINGGTTGLDWKNIATTPGLAYGKPESVGYDDPTAVLSGTWTADQDVSATVHSINQTDNEFQEVELRLRSSITAHSNTGYEINFRCLKTSSAYMQVVRWNGPLGDFTYLNSWSGSQYGVTEGDVVRARIVGNTITVYINGIQRGQVSDSTYASGAPGMGFYGKTAANGTHYGFTSFSVGNPTH